MTTAPDFHEQDLPALITVAELTALLRLHKQTVYELIREGEIPGVRKVGRHYRIHRDTVLEWMADGCGE